MLIFLHCRGKCEIMKSKILIIILILFMFTLSIGGISAEEISDNVTGDNVLDLSATQEQIVESQDIDDKLEASNGDSEILADVSSGKTITIVADKNNPNQVLKPTVQPAIDAADPGDTIILKGNFVHCHFTINKKLNIITNTGTYLDACPHHTHEGVSEFGIFYITEGGSGSLIQGFNFNNNDNSSKPFAFLIRGASNVIIDKCSVDFIKKLPENDNLSGIIIENSNGITLSNLVLNNTINGIRIINSTNVNIINCKILNTDTSGISVSSDSSNINILNNQIINSAICGIKLEGVNYVTVNNNLIQNNGLNNADTGSGIYVNSNITKLTVKGNVFLSNGLHGILYDYRTRNLNNEEGADQLTIVDNNYFEGHKSMILHHTVYIEYENGDYNYDAENDVFVPAENGNYTKSNSYVYMRHAMIYNDIPCGYTYYTTKIHWSTNAEKYGLYLYLSDIKEVKNGVYQISIVNSKGEVATDFNSVYMTFFLNNYSTIKPKQNDVSKTVLMKNGVATADFRDVYYAFKSSNNVITAVFPGVSAFVRYNLFETFNVTDSHIPINPSTSIIASKFTTYPLSNSYYSVKLVDSKGKPISGQTITFKFNGKTYNAKTNSNGIAKVKVYLSSKKSYTVTLSYNGNDDYKASKATSKIVVKAGSKKSKIKSSNMKIKKNKKKTFKMKLTTSAGKALKNQVVKVKFNGKTYTKKTNKKGIVKLAIKLKKAKKYKIKMNFLGNANYKAVSKTNTITVTKK